MGLLNPPLPPQYWPYVCVVYRLYSHIRPHVKYQIVELIDELNYFNELLPDLLINYLIKTLYIL